MRLFLLISVISIIISCVVCKQCDPETSCDENETCCKLQGDAWGCCPMKSAVCCDDHTHCCPSGTKCDTEGARCVGVFGVEKPMGKKRPATKTVIRNEFNEIICPDSGSKCPDGSTCCMLEQGQYGCCPVPQAVCCPDMLHCCPHGFECHGQFCSQKFAKIPHLRKFPSSSIQRKPAIEFIPYVENEVIPEMDSDETNDESEELSNDVRPITCGVGKTCPAKTTCCEIEKNDGDVDYLCCPLSNAVCCQDTCCPSGYHCIRGGKCEKHATSNIESFWNRDSL